MTWGWGRGGLGSHLSFAPPQDSLEQFKSCLCGMLLGEGKKNNEAARQPSLYQPSS